MIAEVQKIDLETLFFRILKIPVVKILILIIHFAKKKFARGQQILQRPIFKYGRMTTFFGHAVLRNIK